MCPTFGQLIIRGAILYVQEQNKKSINKMGVGGARINQKYVFGRIFPNWLKRTFIMHRTQIATKGTYFIQIKKFFS